MSKNTGKAKVKKLNTSEAKKELLRLRDANQFRSVYYAQVFRQAQSIGAIAQDHKVLTPLSDAQLR